MTDRLTTTDEPEAPTMHPAIRVGLWLAEERKWTRLALLTALGAAFTIGTFLGLWLVGAFVAPAGLS